VVQKFTGLFDPPERVFHVFQPILMEKNTNLFAPILKGKTVIFGIGNTLRGDDGLGSVLVNTIAGKIDALCLDGGNAPENYLGKILKERPDTLLIIDALHLGEQPGTFKLLKPDELRVSYFSTHSIPLRILIEYLEDELHSDIYIIGVQPSSLTLGEPISEPVKKAIQRIATLIIQAVSPKKSFE